MDARTAVRLNQVMDRALYRANIMTEHRKMFCCVQVIKELLIR